MSRAVFLASAVALGLSAAPAWAQMDHSNMPGMKMPAEPAAKPQPRPTAKPAPKPASRAKPPGRPAAPAQRQDPKTSAPTTPAADPHAGHQMDAAPTEDLRQPAGRAQDSEPKPTTPAEVGSDPHAGHDMSSMRDGATASESAAVSGHGTGGTALPAGSAPAPAAPVANYADRYYDPREMAAARARLRREHGGAIIRQVIFNLAEYQVRNGADGFRWDGEGWIGGDINRLAIKTEGEGAFGEGVEDAEIQALYSRAIGPYFNLQAGIRYDIKPNPSRTYATIGFEGLAPYWFDVEGALFLSDKGDVLARLEGYYDQRITQRLILQPRAEFNFAAQDVPANGIGSGLSDIELGLRLRYEIEREFAPYVGVSWDRKVGDTARFARSAGKDTGGLSFVVGLRTWF